MRGINSIFIAFLVFSLVMVSLYVVSEFNVGTKIQFAVKPGALYVVQSYQLYDENGKPITKAYPGQTVKMKVCVKPTSSSVTSYLYREVFVEGGIYVDVGVGIPIRLKLQLYSQISVPFESV